MILICSYCRKYLGEKEPLENTNHTHGMCSDCHSRLMRQLEGISFTEFLDDFDKPIAIINKEGRVAAANNKALQMLDKPLEKVQGFLGGEALECGYAQLPEGCGETAHCPACTIRNLVEATMRTQTSSEKVKVYLKTDEGEFAVIVSTSSINDMVQIIFEEMTLVRKSQAL